MTVSGAGAVPAAVSQPPEGATAADGEHGSMSRQDVWDNHGHEMHPQQFVRLVGCHDQKTGSHLGAGQH